VIVPSIDIMNGNAVQLVRGERLAIDAGDPLPIAERFSVAGEIAVIDLDAARGEGDNSALVEEIIRIAPCRVGGGIRDYASAVRWLDLGAEKIILGTAAEPSLLKRLPRERVIVALDHVDGDIVAHGWRRRTGKELFEHVHALRPYAGGFLVTFVQDEGGMGGLPLDSLSDLVEAAGDARVTIAGGTRCASEIGNADRLGADVQVGMALYRGDITLADSIGSVMRSDRADGLWPTIVTDERGVALGLTYSNQASLSDAVESGRGVYWSRSRNELWRKGDTSGDYQDLLRVDIDCDRDTLRFTVRQHGRGFCHSGTRTCFGDSRGLSNVCERIADRVRNPICESYTARLLANPTLLRNKLIEEAGELADATSAGDVAWEAADVLYFALVALARAGVGLDIVERELDRRARIVTRRKGDAKVASIATEPAT